MLFTRRNFEFRYAGKDAVANPSLLSCAATTACLPNDPSVFPHATQKISNRPSAAKYKIPSQ